MHWMIGIETEAFERGPTVFARWLHASNHHRFDGLHVVELSNELALIQAEGAGPPVDILAAARDALAPLAKDPLFGRVDAIKALTAVEGMTQSAAERAIGGFVIGRTRYFHREHSGHLGRVARRMLRHLTLPTVIVPPDLASVPAGPILLATDFDDASDAATRFAKQLAADLGREIVPVHVRPSADYFDQFLTPEDHKLVIEHAGARERAAMVDWAAKHGLSNARTMVVQGPTVPRLMELAQTHDAAMIVVGSRGLSTLERIFTSSVGSHLAAHAQVPVAVVPHG